MRDFTSPQGNPTASLLPAVSFFCTLLSNALISLLYPSLFLLHVLTTSIFVKYLNHHLQIFSRTEPRTIVILLCRISAYTTHPHTIHMRPCTKSLYRLMDSSSLRRKPIYESNKVISVVSVRIWHLTLNKSDRSNHGNEGSLEVYMQSIGHAETQVVFLWNAGIHR